MTQHSSNHLHTLPQPVRRLGLVPQTQTGDGGKFVLFVDQVLNSTDILPLLPKQRVGGSLFVLWPSPRPQWHHHTLTLTSNPPPPPSLITQAGPDTDLGHALVTHYIPSQRQHQCGLLDECLDLFAPILLSSIRVKVDHVIISIFRYSQEVQTLILVLSAKSPSVFERGSKLKFKGWIHFSGKFTQF